MKILLVEDDERTADVIKYWLDTQAFSVSVVHTGTEAGSHAASADLAIIDVLLPDGSGFDVCQSIKEMPRAIPVLMLSGLDSTEDKLRAFEAGADDYMIKPCDLRELTARINVLLKRSGHLNGKTHSQVLSYDDLKMDLQTKLVTRADRSVRLTPREFGLLEYLMRNPERIISREEIAQSVWDTSFDTKTNFIDVYINYLRNKMDRDFSSKLIHTKSGMGIMFSKTP